MSRTLILILPELTPDAFVLYFFWVYIVAILCTTATVAGAGVAGAVTSDIVK